MLGLGKSPDLARVRSARCRWTRTEVRRAVGVACLVGTVLAVTGWWTVDRLSARIAGFGPSVGCLALTVSSMVRAADARGRVQTRLLLLAGSAAAGGLYRAAVDVLSAHPPTRGPDVRPLLAALVVTGLTMAVGLGMAGLVVAADAGTGRHVWMRRVLDGVLAAGSVFMTGWLMLRGAGDGWRLERGMLGVLWTAEVVFVGFLFALRRLVRSDQRATVWVAVVGLCLMLIGDTVRLRRAGPSAPEVMSSQLADGCVTAGLLVIAVAPWVPGGASVLGAHRTKLRLGMEGAAAFIVLTVCTVTALGYALAPLAYDPVSLSVGGTVLLGLWTRRTLAPGERTTGDD